MVPLGGPLLRVLQVAAGYPPYIGGVETHVSEVAPRLAARGLSVTVLTTDRSGGLPATEQVGGVSIRRVAAWPRRSDYFFAPGIYRTIRDGGWDLVHCQGYHTFVAPLAMLAASRARLPYVLTFHSGGHSSRVRNALRGVQLTVLRPLLMRAARLIAVSDWELQFFARRLRLSRRRFALIPNGARLPEIDAAADGSGGAYDDGSDAQSVPSALIVSVGRLERYKGHDRIVEAMPHVLRECASARLRIAGDGPERSRLRRLAAELGVSDRVEIGPIPPGDRRGMAALLAEAAVVVSLSDYESQGIAVMEALAMRRPTVVTQTSALGSLADAGLATAVAPGAVPREVAAAVIAQLRAPVTPGELLLPSWDACADRLEVLYREVLKGSACAS